MLKVLESPGGCRVQLTGILTHSFHIHVSVSFVSRNSMSRSPASSTFLNPTSPLSPAAFNIRDSSLLEALLHLYLRTASLPGFPHDLLDIPPSLLRLCFLLLTSNCWKVLDLPFLHSTSPGDLIQPCSLNYLLHCCQFIASYLVSFSISILLHPPTSLTSSLAYLGGILKLPDPEQKF